MQGKTIQLKRGFDIKLQGLADPHHTPSFAPRTFAVKPPDFQGLSPIPKLTVAVGDEVQAGDQIFFDKKRPEVFYCAPVSGEIAEVKRGPKRAIHEVIILADAEIKFKAFDPANPAELNREQIIERMLTGGLWPFLRQRPFDFVPQPTDQPKAIFISGFDSAPLAADYNVLLDGETEAFQIGITALQKLTTGAVHLSVNAQGPVPEAFTSAQGVKLHRFNGPHPAGNVGVQIHHLDPLNKGEVAWVIKPQDVVVIGRHFRDGQFNTMRKVAFAGAEFKQTGYVQTYQGACIEGLTKDNLAEGKVRLVSGNLLTGTQVAPNGYLGFLDDLVTAVVEGNDPELLGWLIPSYKRPSQSKTFLSYLRPDFAYRVNTNPHGEERPFVMTGEYEAVLPMDLLPQHLLKSILFRDYDQMEGLGIYEVVEEDLALCEFVCTSKVPVQEILREGLNDLYLQG